MITNEELITENLRLNRFQWKFQKHNLVNMKDDCMEWYSYKFIHESERLFTISQTDRFKDIAENVFIKHANLLRRLND